jgi:two-component system response regulator FixJ
VTEPGPGIVYVIDDDDGVRDSLLFLFGVDDLPALGFSSAEAFLAALPERPVGCIVTDMQMPGEQGANLLRILPQRAVLMPVIVMTGQGDVATALNVLKAGAFDFIEKPFQDTTILNAVRAALTAGHRDIAQDARARVARDAIARFSGRDRAVLDGLVDGESNSTIAARTELPVAEVELVRAAILQRLQASGLPDLIRLVVAGRRLAGQPAGYQTPESR